MINCTLLQTLNTVIDAQSEWSQATFGTDEEKGPLGSLNHLRKECVEVIEAVKSYVSPGRLGHLQSKNNVEEEFADCLLLLLDAMRRQKITLPEIVQAAYDKQQENCIRKWNVHRWEYRYEMFNGTPVLYKCTARKRVDAHLKQPEYFDYGYSPDEAKAAVLVYVRKYEDDVFTEHTRE